MLQLTCRNSGSHKWLCLAGMTLAAGLGLVLIAQAEPAKAPKPDRWAKTIEAFEAWDRKNAWPVDGVLFVGSSSIVRWQTRECFPNLPVINRGFGGSQVSDVNRHLDRVVLPYRPKAIVFYAGDNDIAGGKTAAQVLADYQTFVNKLHEKLPKTLIIFVTIKPSRLRWHLWPTMKEANRLIEAFSQKDPRLIFADTATPMLNSQGEPRAELLADDNLHLSEEGYKVWTRIVAPLIETAMR